MTDTDQDLLSRLHKAVKEERNATLFVLNLLRETNDRQLHLKLGYGSLLEFCIKELKYSETSANRRISAMYAMLSVPVIEEKIQSGNLSLDVIAKAQSHIRQKEKISSVKVGHKVKINPNERASLFESLSGLSCREAEKELIKQDPEVFDIKNKKDSLRQITPELQELKIILDPEMQADIEKLKLLLSHVIPGATIKEVLKFALKESIKKRDMQRPVRESVKRRGGQRSVQTLSLKQDLRPSTQQPTNKQFEQIASKKRHAQPAPVDGEFNLPSVQTRIGPSISSIQNQIAQGPIAATIQTVQVPVAATIQTAQGSVAAAIHTGVRVLISTAVKRAVWTKSQGQCCYRHNGRRCSSRFQLQIDHILARAKGGSNDLGNLQLLCRLHNQMKGMDSVNRTQVR